jgi:hypothetical protein
MLLLLDSCEHVIKAAAADGRQRCGRPHHSATSREPLGYPVSGCIDSDRSAPSHRHRLTAPEAAAFPPRNFVERVTAIVKTSR